MQRRGYLFRRRDSQKWFRWFARHGWGHGASKEKDPKWSPAEVLITRCGLDEANMRAVDPL